jgi:hypothetical protein
MTQEPLTPHNPPAITQRVLDNSWWRSKGLSYEHKQLEVLGTMERALAHKLSRITSSFTHDAVNNTPGGEYAEDVRQTLVVLPL